MEEGEKHLGRAIMAHQETTIGAQPGNRSLHDPSSAVASKHAPVFESADAAVLPVGADQLDPALGEGAPEWIAVVAAISDQTRGLRSRVSVASKGNGNGLQRAVDERRFRR